MRKASFNNYEFDTPSAEESLNVAQAPRAEFPTLSAFLAALGVVDSSASSLVPVEQLAREHEIRAHLARLDWGPTDFDQATALLLAEDWWEFEVALVDSDGFTWLRWETTA